MTLQGLKQNILVKMPFDTTYFLRGETMVCHFLLRLSALLHTKSWKLISCLHKMEEG